MHKFVSVLLLSTMAFSLSGCAGYEKGNGLSRLDSSGIDSEDAAWYKNYYGKSHCVWGSDCGSAGGSNDKSSEGSSGSGGGFWSGGVGPSDSGSTDSGSQ